MSIPSTFRHCHTGTPGQVQLAIVECPAYKASIMIPPSSCCSFKAGQLACRLYKEQTPSWLIAPLLLPIFSVIPSKTQHGCPAHRIVTKIHATIKIATSSNTTCTAVKFTRIGCHKTAKRHPNRCPSPVRTAAPSTKKNICTILQSLCFTPSQLPQVEAHAPPHCFQLSLQSTVNSSPSAQSQSRSMTQVISSLSPADMAKTYRTTRTKIQSYNTLAHSITGDSQGLHALVQPLSSVLRTTCYAQTPHLTTSTGHSRH